MADTEDRLSVDSGGRGLLAHLNGAAPAAPDWLTWANGHEPEAHAVEVRGAKIAFLAWGERGLPGLLLLHGNGAHAHWWRFIAPFFADAFRVVAPTWSGMGDSDWRQTYSIETFGAEALAAAEAGGLFDAPVPPVVAAHSFGGYPALWLAREAGARLRLTITLDSPIEPPESRHEGPPGRTRPNRIYPTLEAALARFRLAPEQPCENLALVDMIARHSIKEVEGGFTWKFDPFIWQRMAGFEDNPMDGARCPLAVVYGDQSLLMPAATLAHMRSLAPAGTPFVGLPFAAHHVMLDQPLALTAVLRALIAGAA